MIEKRHFSFGLHAAGCEKWTVHLLLPCFLLLDTHSITVCSAVIAMDDAILLFRLMALTGRSNKLVDILKHNDLSKQKDDSLNERR